MAREFYSYTLLLLYYRDKIQPNQRDYSDKNKFVNNNNNNNKRTNPTNRKRPYSYHWLGKCAAGTLHPKQAKPDAFVTDRSKCSFCFVSDAALIPLIEDLFKELAMIEACNKVIRFLRWIRNRVKIFNRWKATRIKPSFFFGKRGKSDAGKITIDVVFSPDLSKNYYLCRDWLQQVARVSVSQ